MVHTLLLALFALAFGLCRATSVRAGGSNGVDVWHRVLCDGAFEKAAWTLRGTYDRQLGWIPDDAAFVALQDEGDLYQLGLGSSAAEVKSFISVPECQLRSSNGASLRDTITIYFRSTDTSEPFHLKYTVAGAPAKSQNCSTLKRASDFTTDLKLEHPQRVEKPQLLPAIVVQYAEDGTAKVPEPEKSFLAKYWIYLVPLVLLLLTSGTG